jgi:hypothetical protein
VTVTVREQPRGAEVEIRLGGRRTSELQVTLVRRGAKRGAHAGR